MIKKPLFPAHYDTVNILNFPDFWEPDLVKWCAMWIQDLQSGVQPLTPASLRSYQARFIRYTQFIHGQTGKTVNLAECLDISTLYSRISSFPIESFSNRHNTFYALHSLARFLIKLGQLDEGHIARMKPFRPKRVIPAKKTVLRDEKMVMLFKEALQHGQYYSKWSCLSVTTIIETLIQPGLRSAELSGLRMQDVDLVNRRLLVNLGKGRKSRTVGITEGLHEVLTVYLEARMKQALTCGEHDPFFF